MNTLAQQFLTEKERDKITQTVHRAEQVTSGEIVPMVVSHSSEYRAAAIIGGFLLSFLFSLLGTPFIGKALWLGSNNMLLFVGCFLVLFYPFYVLVGRLPRLKRLFLIKKEISQEVEEHAVISFFEEQLYETREKNGILIFISVFEHHVVILGDSGINEKIDLGSWKKMVDHIIDGIKNNHQCDAICEVIEDIGSILQSHFPIRDDDENELHDLIIR